MGELALACPWTVEESSCLRGCDDRQGGAGALWMGEGAPRGTQCQPGQAPLGRAPTFPGQTSFREG